MKQFLGVALVLTIIISVFFNTRSNEVCQSKVQKYEVEILNLQDSISKLKKEIEKLMLKPQDTVISSNSEIINDGYYDDKGHYRRSNDGNYYDENGVYRGPSGEKLLDNGVPDFQELQNEMNKRKAGRVY